MNDKAILTKKRISELRDLMNECEVQAYIIPLSDPHLSEYVPEKHQRVKWLTPFTGSAATVVITDKKSGLWTDSRYFLQGEIQLEETEITLFKTGEKNVPTIKEWIADNLKGNDRVGTDPEFISAEELTSYKEDLSSHNINIKTDCGFEQTFFSNIAKEPTEKAFLHEEKYSGKSSADKLQSVRSLMANNKADALIVSSLDEIAWLYNIRGKDIPYNPVVTAFSVITKNSATIYIDENKVSDIKNFFCDEKIKIRPYSCFYEQLSTIQNICVWADLKKVNYKIYEILNSNNNRIQNSRSPIESLKAIKNSTETEGIRKCVIKDAKALKMAFSWLEKKVISGEKVTEIDFSEKLYRCREAQELFVEESFSTIAAFGKNGAIVHYNPKNGGNSEIKSGNLFLVDSGGNYLDGTTDITRTVYVGKSTPTEQMIKDYTLVLKGHIAIAAAVFPVGTHGVQIDAFARQFLWKNGLNYGHGTGHGIGHFLNVHEGPQNIRTADNGVALEAGMLISNEPGLYRKDEYGIRLENMVMVIPSPKHEDFLEFETLTLYPFDEALIDWSMLNEEETAWLKDYQNKSNSVINNN